MLTKALFYSFRFFVRLLPLALALFIGKMLGWLWYYVIPIRKTLVKKQIKKALGKDLDASTVSGIARRMFENLGQNFIEFFLFDPAKPAEMTSLVEYKNKEILDAAVAQNKGVLVLTAHFGNWDLLCCSQALAGLPLTIISKNIKPDWLNDYWMNTRKACGVNILPDRDVKQQLLQKLNQGEVIGFVIDQHAPERFGVVVDFFDMPASTTSGFARLAIESGAPVVPVFITRRKNGKHLMEVFDPVEIVEGEDLAETIILTTYAYNKVLEDCIRRNPDHWLWLHRRWKVAEQQASTPVQNHEVL